MTEPMYRDEDFILPMTEVKEQLNTIIYQLRTDDILENLERSLRGERFNTVENKWELTGKQLINDEGVRTLVTYCQTVINKNTILSNFDEKDIEVIMRESHICLSQLLFLNYKKYDLAKEHMTPVLYQVLFFLYPGLLRAKDEGERVFLTQTHQIIEKISRGIDNAEKSKRFFGLFGGGGNSGGDRK